LLEFHRRVFYAHVGRQVKHSYPFSNFPGNIIYKWFPVISSNSIIL
jgi:hypothetical protein